MVEPVDPFDGSELDGLEVVPWSLSVDHLGLVKALIVSAKALSKLSPTLPTDGLMSASAGSSVNFMDTYCDPRSL
jgi:hypothetical protein